MQKRAVKRATADVDALRESVLASMNSDMQIRDALRIENSKLAEENETLLEYRAEREEEIARLDARMSEIAARCVEKEKECDVHRNLSDETKNKISDLEIKYIKNNAELSKKYAESEGELNKKSAVIQREFETAVEKLETAKKKTSTILSEYESMKKDTADMDVQLKLSDNKMKTLIVSIEAKKMELAGIEGNIIKQNEENISLTNIGKEIRREMQLLGEKKDKAERETSLTEHELRKANSELVVVQNKMFSLIKRESRVNELVPQIKELCERIGIDPKL
jgi:chromosome segregation ATPase